MCVFSIREFGLERWARYSMVESDSRLPLTREWFIILCQSESKIIFFLSKSIKYCFHSSWQYSDKLISSAPWKTKISSWSWTWPLSKTLHEDIQEDSIVSRPPWRSRERMLWSEVVSSPPWRSQERLPCSVLVSSPPWRSREQLAPSLPALPSAADTCNTSWEAIEENVDVLCSKPMM